MGPRTLRVASACAVAGALLAGCGSDQPSSGAGAPDLDASPTPHQVAGASPAPRRGGAGDGIGDGNGVGSGEEPDRRPGRESSGDGDVSGSGNDDPSPGLEMPQAPEAPPTSLSQLLASVRTAPLVTAPLPRAASARGRLVARFPAVLRPTRATRVTSSSISPSEDRLQVGLVASTRLSPEQVLASYRARLATRGLVEQATPAAMSGSQAAAFRRGPNTVTITVTPEGTRTSYAVLASLRTGRE